MLVSLKWLADYVPLTLPPRALADRLTIAGVKVERIISRGEEWDGVRVGAVAAVQPHPNADRLRLVTVDLGQPEKRRWSAARQTSPSARRSLLAPSALVCATAARASGPT